MKLLIQLTLLLFLNQLSAQLYHESYDWEDKLDISSYQTIDTSDIITFKDAYTIEYGFEGENLFEYRLTHKIHWVNSDDKIEENNKIYLPINYTSELLTSKARVISPSNEVQTLDESMILTAKDDEQNQSYSYFALEGLEIGSFIEYFYITKNQPLYKGRKISFQDDKLKKNVSFKLFTPDHLTFAFRSYNGFPELRLDTSYADKNAWVVDVESLPAAKKERESAHFANRQYFVYKLDKNSANNTSNIISYNSQAKLFYEHLFIDLDKKQKKNIGKFLKEINIPKNADKETKIRKVENYLKKNIYLTKISDDNMGDLEYIIKNKTANDVGLLRLFLATSKSLDIKTEVILTSNRFNTKFDPEFEANNFLEEYLLYFPEVDKYTNLSRPDARLGYPPNEYSNNYGLFVKEISVGNLTSGIGKVKFIPSLEDTCSLDIMEFTVKFDPEDYNNLDIYHKRSLGGYKASFHSYLDYMNEEEKTNLFQSIIQSMNENVEVKNLEVENDKTDLYGVLPLVISADVETDLFVDKVGNKYLFKIGELIGRQVEMYSDSLRTQGVELDYRKKYLRTITVHLPENTTVKGLESINIQKFLDKDGKRVLEFHSHYELKDNILTVYADEYYNAIELPLEDFEAYREVINAAANFNKVVLLIE